jgi:hypothetical protein
MDTQFLLKRLSEVVRTDATVANIPDFLATHFPFRSLKYTNSGQETESLQKLHEETFFRERIIKDRSSHNFIVIQGDNGSGKSHFIRWIKERYSNEVNEDEEAVLLITRSQSTLRGALKQIIDSNIFPDEFKSDELKRIIEADDNLSKDMLERNIIHQFAIEVEGDHSSNNLLDETHRKWLSVFLTDLVIKEKLLLKKGGPIERIKCRLDADKEGQRNDDIEPKFYPDDFEIKFSGVKTALQGAEGRPHQYTANLAEKLESDMNGPKLRENIAKYLNGKIEAVVQRCINLRASDLRQIFEKLRVELKNQGKNLTLFIEDITSFTGIDKALVEVLVTEHSGEFNQKFCRIFSVVGVTTAYYNGHFPENLKDRVTGRVIIDDQSLIANEHQLSEMTARYINAVNLRDEELKVWMENGAIEGDLPIAKENLKYKWSNVNLGDGRELSIFPLTSSALWNMYTRLPHKTPRKFLNGILRNIYQLYFYDPMNFPPDEKTLEQGIIKIPGWKNQLHEQIVWAQAGEMANKVGLLLRLWGDGTVISNRVDGVKLVGGLSEQVFRVFDLPFIEGIEDNAPIPQTNPINIANQRNEITVTVGPPKVATKEEKAFNDLQQEILEWFDGNPLKDHVDLRTNLKDVLTTFIDWEFEGVPKLMPQTFLTLNRISIEGQTSKADKGFQVKRSQGSKFALIALAAWQHLGKKTWFFEGASGHLNNMTNWLLTVKKEVIDSIVAPQDVENPEEWQMAKWGMASEFCTQLFSGKLYETDNINDIYSKIFTKEIDVQPQQHRSPEWKSLQAMLNRKNDEIKEQHNFNIRYFVTGQGDAAILSTPTIFLDARSALEVLEHLENISWDLKEISLPDIKSSSKVMWYRAFNFIKDLRELVESALEGEISSANKLIMILSYFLGDAHTENDVAQLFEDMKGFIRVLNEDLKDNVSDAVYGELISDILRAEDLYNSERTIEKVLELDKKTQLLSFSQNHLKNLQPYVDLMANMNKLVAEKKSKYSTRLNNFSGQDNDVKSVKREIEHKLIKLKTDLLSVNGGDINAN